MKKTTLALALASALLGNSAFAANAAFQSFFDQACVNAAGEMATRCNGPTGTNISGDSESSLTPSHMLSAGDSSLLSNDTDIQSGGQLAKIGPLSVSINLTAGELDSEERDSNKSERGFTSDMTRFAINADYRHSEQWVSGLIFSVQNSELEFEALTPGGAFPTLSRAGEYDTDRFGLTAFTQFNHRNGLFADASISYDVLDHTFKRNSVYQPSNRSFHVFVNTKANADGDYRALLLRGGKHFSYGAWTLSPTVSLMRARTVTDSYREKDSNNSGLAMRYNTYQQDSQLATLGASLQRPFTTDFGVISTQLRADYHREMMRDGEKIEASFINDPSGTAFVVEGDEPDKSYVRAAFSLVTQIAHGWSVFLDHEQWLGNNEFDQRWTTLGVRKEL